MPFAKQWRAAMYPDYIAQNAYVDYKGAKDVLHRMKVDIADPTTPEILLKTLLEEKKRVYQWCTQKVVELTELAKMVEACSRRFDPHSVEAAAERDEEREEGEEVELLEVTPATPLPSRDPRHALPVESVKAAADAILHELLRFHECRNLNTDTIEHIIRRQFRYTPLQPTGHWIEVTTENDFMSIALDEIFYLLSVVYERVKQAIEGHQEKQKHPAGAVGSQTFDRRSVKYWVHKQDLPFVIARVIQHLPVSHIKDVYKEFQDAGQPYCLGQRISSVYYDNSEFLFYHRRLERLEGCSLIRLRWYADTLEPDMNALKPNSDVFVEMKVHHEAWSGERSTKKRFVVKERDVDAYMRGQLSLEPAIEKLRKKNTSEREIEKFRDLASDILGKFKSYDMKPVLRTQCCRAAFQRGQDQSVRVSIDTDLRMCSEDFGLSNHWRHEGEPLGVSDFPYAVVEVKLQCAENERLAPWIEELLKCRHMESVPKFSKYAHGIAALFGHTARISRVPYWLHQVNADIRAAYKPEESGWDPTVGLAKNWWERFTDRAVFGTQPPQNQRAALRFLANKSLGRIYSQMLNSKVSAKDAITYDVERRHEAFAARITQQNVESVCFGGYADSGKTLIGGIPWQTGKAVKVPQKFDPKTLLTSERYMLKWVQNATVMAVAGLASIRFGYGGNLPSSHHMAHATAGVPILFMANLHVYLGTTLCFLSVLVSLYALFTFRARALRVYARKKIRFDDVNGPTALTLVILFTIAAVAANRVLVRYAPMLTGSDDI